jgi:hypothetical protein
MILTDERRDSYLPLKEAGVPKTALERLTALGVTTLQELRDFWTYGNRQLLLDYLGETPVWFAAVRPTTAGFTRDVVKGPGNLVNLLAEGTSPPLVKRSRGLVLSVAERQRPAEAPAPVMLGAGRKGMGTSRGGKVVSLAGKFPPVRDQRVRGTCVAFSSVALLEFHLSGGAPRTKKHSEQFLFWACKQKDGNPAVDGTILEVASGVMADQGVCLAKTWPYNPLPGTAIGQGPPPAGAIAEAKSSLWPGCATLAPGDLDALQALLDAGRPFALGVRTYPSWEYPSVADSGEVPMPLPRMNPDGGHAVCVVGYEVRSGVPGGGAFIFRNSWGKTWARRSRFRPGYGTLFFEYVRREAVEAIG